MDNNQIYKNVQRHYGSLARSNTSCEYSHKVSKAFGYSEADLLNTPGDANLGVSCGNPIALANLREGETVIDFGSGAGFDVFIASEAVGSAGKVIGVDMNKDMLERANRNKETMKTKNVTFIESQITDIKLPDSIADCIISNCVVNLVPESEKHLAFKEMFRLLKPGGRLAISDILAKKQLPEDVRESVALYVGCIAGASQVEDYKKYLHEAGFIDPIILDTQGDLNVYTTESGENKADSCCKPHSTCDITKPREVDAKDIDLNEWAGSFKIYAVKQ